MIQNNFSEQGLQSIVAHDAAVIKNLFSGRMYGEPTHQPTSISGQSSDYKSTNCIYSIKTYRSYSADNRCSIVMLTMSHSADFNICMKICVNILWSVWLPIPSYMRMVAYGHILDFRDRFLIPE